MIARGVHGIVHAQFCLMSLGNYPQNIVLVKDWGILDNIFEGYNAAQRRSRMPPTPSSRVPS